MNFESQLRVSGRLLTAAVIIIASVLMIATVLSCFRSQLQVPEVARRAVVQHDLKSRYQEFYSDDPVGQSSASTSVFTDACMTAASTTRNCVDEPQIVTCGSTSPASRSFVSVERSTNSSNGGPSVTVPVTINVNNGDLLSELLQVRQEVSNLQQMRQVSSSTSASAETSEREFSYVVHDNSPVEMPAETTTAKTVTSAKVQSTTDTSRPVTAAEKSPHAVPIAMAALPESKPLPSRDVTLNESFESFEPDNASPPHVKPAPDEEEVKLDNHQLKNAHRDNFVPPDAKRVMPMLYQSVSTVVEISEMSLDDDQEIDEQESTPFMEIVTEAPQPLPVLESTEKSDSLVFEPLNEIEPSTLPAIEFREALEAAELAPEPMPFLDRRAKLPKAFEVVRGLPPESLFDEVTPEPTELEYAFLPIPTTDESDNSDAADAAADTTFHDVSMPTTEKVAVSEFETVVQTATSSKPLTSVPPIPMIAISQDEAAEDDESGSHEFQIPNSLDLDNAVAASDDFHGPTDIFQLPDESEFATDPARDRALKIAQSPASEEHFDTRSSDQLVPRPTPQLPIPEMVQTPSYQSMPEFMPPASMPAHPAYRTMDPNATTMSLAVRRFKKRMAQVTGSVGSSMPEIDRPDFELGDLPLAGGFQSQGAKKQRSPQHHPSPPSFAKGYQPQPAGPSAPRSKQSWFAMPQLSKPQFSMPQFEMPELAMPGFMTAQDDCQHCNGGTAAPGPMQVVTESPTIHRAMSTMRFAGRTKTVE